MIRLGAAIALIAAPAAAVTVDDCIDHRADAAAIMEPWEENTATYASGRIRVAVMDSVEPAAGALHLLVLSPPFNELGERQCKIVSFDKTQGFAAVWFTERSAAYNPLTGLTLTVPVQFWLPDLSFTNSAQLSVTINQSTGDIVTDFAVGGAE